MELLGQFKLAGMRAAYNEVVAEGAMVDDGRRTARLLEHIQQREGQPRAIGLFDQQWRAVGAGYTSTADRVTETLRQELAERPFQRVQFDP